MIVYEPPEVPDMRAVLMRLAFTVHGLPAPQGSKRHVGSGIMVESSKAVGPWREAVRAETQAAVTAAGGRPKGPVRVDLTFRLPRPRGHFGRRGLLPSAPLYPTVRPDLDKLARAALDGMVTGGAIRDDADVVELRVVKDYADDLYPPGLTVAVQRQL